MSFFFGSLDLDSFSTSAFKYYPNWTITPDSSRQASSYWKWFVAKYSAKIAQHFNAKETEIPDGWMSLTWEEVKEDLKTSYNL